MMWLEMAQPLWKIFFCLKVLNVEVSVWLVTELCQPRSAQLECPRWQLTPSFCGLIP